MIGTSIQRVGDRRLLTGAGRYSDDFNRPGQTYAAFVRAALAHADIVSIDREAAARMPGVVGIFTHDDLAATGNAEISTGIAGRGAGYPNRDGSAMANPPYHVLARDRVRYGGEAVALVIAESPEAARDAAEAVAVDYRPRAAVTGADRAVLPGSPQLWPEAPLNTCYDWADGDGALVAQALAKSDHVTVLDVAIGRVVPAFMEPRAALADFDAATGRFEIIAGCQGIHGLRDKLAACLSVAPACVRVLSPDVGGAFGARSVLYPEYPALAWAARRVGRAVKWTATRGEDFLTSTQGRDSILRGELGLDREGRFLGLRVSGIADMGARHTGNGPYSVMRNLARMLPGVYRTPAVCLELRGVFTNTVPVSSYRGVGRMEAIYLMERLVDQAAREIGADRVELRRLNLVPPDAMPYATPMGSIYDSGDYGSHMDKAMAAADWQDFPTRRAVAARAGRLRGIGLANYIEGAGGGAGEYAALRIDENGVAHIGAGCVDQGQGHATTLRQIAASQLGIEVGQIEVCASDTDLIADGVGTNASRSMVRAGAALVAAADQLIETGRRQAAALLQADADAVSYSDGRYHGTAGRAVELAEVARAMDVAFQAAVRTDDDAVTYPNGCHICEVEIDPETGAVEVVSFIAVDDVGRAINPPIVHGQSQGGIAQGIGQALMECGLFDPETGQLLSGSFLDYAMPRAEGLPSLRPIANDFPSPTNTLGVKGAGEGGATGAPAAVMNAVLDALACRGVHDIALPATAERIWAALKRPARKGAPG